jgi:hypothetical protein
MALESSNLQNPAGSTRMVKRFSIGEVVQQINEAVVGNLPPTRITDTMRISAMRAQGKRISTWCACINENLFSIDILCIQRLKR